MNSAMPAVVAAGCRFGVRARLLDLVAGFQRLRCDRDAAVQTVSDLCDALKWLAVEKATLSESEMEKLQIPSMATPALFEQKSDFV